MSTHVFLKLREAVNLDFSDNLGNKKHGVAYFCKNKIGMIEKKINYFTDTTDLQVFRDLYARKQIFVIANPNEAVAVDVEILK